MNPAVRAAARVPCRQLSPGARAALLLGDTDGCRGLHQRRLTITAPHQDTAAGAGEAWYVIAGSGTLRATRQDPATQDAATQDMPLEAGTAVWLPAGTAYRAAGDGLEVLSVIVRSGAPPATPPHATNLRDCAPEYTGDREFRVLLSEGLTITAFAGTIPPGRAPEHQHSYDEVIHVLAGQGVVHLRDRDAPIGPGTSIYLPPGAPHCLENTGTGTLRVLGVFHPAGSPAAKRETAGHEAAGHEAAERETAERET